MRVRQLSIACAIAIALCRPARADGVGVVAVGQPDAARAVAAALGERARVVDDAIGEARSAVMAGAVPLATLERFRRVREQIDDAWRAFLRVQVELAASRLATARTDAEALVVYPGGALLYADASLRLGAVLSHLGRTAEAQASLALALALDPDRPITLVEFSPDVVAAVDAVRAQKRAMRSLRITSEPAGALISVDGKDVGRAPLSADVALGQHVIVARLPLYQARAQAIAVDDRTPDVALDLERDIPWLRLGEGALLGLDDRAAQELVDATVRFADLDEVVLVAHAEQRGGPAILVQRCVGAPARCTAVVEIGYADRTGLPAAAREALQAARAADLRYAPSLFADARIAGTKIDQRCKVCRSPILWGSVGAIAVIGTIAAIAIVSATRPPPIVDVDHTKF